MYYEIKVTRNGMHCFTTNENSLKYEEQAKDIYDLFKEKFPKSEGYQLFVRRIEKTGYLVDFDEDGNEKKIREIVVK